MKTDIEIAQSTQMRHIADIAKTAGVDEEYLEFYGKYKAKIDYRLLQESDAPNGKLILVTAINPTPAGEGKTTTTVGLADGMRRLGKNALVALREPSLGPVFGVKGGAMPAAMLRSSPWRTSTSTSPATSMPSARPITCWPPCWTTTSSRATPWASTSNASHGSGAWT